MRDSEVDGRATHQKLMVVSGSFARRTDVSYAWTGSHNFSDRSTRNDEVTLRVAGARQVGAYLRSFDRIWAPRRLRCEQLGPLHRRRNDTTAPDRLTA